MFESKDKFISTPYKRVSQLFILWNSDKSILLKFDTYPPSNEDIKFTHASVDKLKSMGFTVPDITLEEGVRKTYDWLVGQNSQIALNAILELNN